MHKKTEWFSMVDKVNLGMASFQVQVLHGFGDCCWLNHEVVSSNLVIDSVEIDCFFSNTILIQSFVRGRNPIRLFLTTLGLCLPLV
jgi:hypothetical protein